MIGYLFSFGEVLVRPYRRSSHRRVYIYKAQESVSYNDYNDMNLCTCTTVKTALKLFMLNTVFLSKLVLTTHAFHPTPQIRGLPPTRTRGVETKFGEGGVKKKVLLLYLLRTYIFITKYCPLSDMTSPSLNLPQQRPSAMRYYTIGVQYVVL